VSSCQELLGVTFSDSFYFDSPVNYILKMCCQRTYLMHKLRDQGLTTNQLNIVPIPKRHNVNKSDSANLRGRALSSIFGKILDNIILDHYHV